ncbi:aspartyl protease family protein [Desulfococcus sp.]|uniref:aspartyl protease family protein n=1 Tax=Desulfococcus sp. TaxID=2025834 RepID=UPI003593ADDA
MRQGLFMTAFFFALIAGSWVGAEFYQYTDKNGQVHFVDDMSKIPESAQGGLKTYRESTDHLPAAEQQRVREAREMAEAEKERENQSRLLQVMEINRKEREAYLAGKKNRGDATPFTLKNNQVLVPVTIGCGRTEVETVLLLDTGASITALHRRVTDGMNIQGMRKAKARTAGGKVIDTHLARVDYIQVGPHRIDDFNTVILDFEGDPADHNGLLGMDFLGRFPHGIDMANRVIRWASR